MKKRNEMSGSGTGEAGIRRRFVAAFLVAFVALAAVLHIDLQLARRDQKDETAAVMSRYASQLSVQFNRWMEDRFAQLDGVAKAISETNGNEEEAFHLLSTLTGGEAFDGAELCTMNGAVIGAGGNVEALPQLSQRLVYFNMSIRGGIGVDAEGSLWLHIDLPHGALGRMTGVSGCLTQAHLLRTLQLQNLNDANFMLFNSIGGAAIYDGFGLDGNGYYDAVKQTQLEQLSGTGIGIGSVVRVAGSDGDAYVCSANTRVGNWAVALRLDADVPALAATSLARRQRSVGGMLLGLLLLLATGLILEHRQIRRMRRRSHDSIETRNTMLQMALSKSKKCMFACNRENDRLRMIFRGISNVLPDDLDTPPETFEKLLRDFEFDEDEIARIRNLSGEVRIGRETEFDAHRVRNGEDQYLHFLLTCSQENENTLIGVVSDNTLAVRSRDRFDEEQRFYQSMRQKCTSIWTVNADRDCWRTEYSLRDAMMETLGIHRAGWRAYGADLEDGLKNYVHPEDHPAYLREMSASAIIAAYHAERTELVCEYRARSGAGGAYEWFRNTLHIYQDPRKGEVFARLYVANVDEEKRAALERRERARYMQQIQTALGGLYYALFYVNLDKDLCYTAKTPGGEVVSEMCTDFKDTFKDFIENIVHPDDRAQMREFMSLYHIRRNITENALNLHCGFRRLSEDGYRRAVVNIQAARFENGTVREVIVALQEIGQGEAWNEQRRPEEKGA